MRFDCGPTPEEIYLARRRWHRWFAWHPVRVGPRECRWLEAVERKGEYQLSYDGGSWTYEYRRAS